MTEIKILFSNLGYARGIDGRLSTHIRHAYRHIMAPLSHQISSLKQLKQIIAKADPDICCFVEIDSGSFSSAGHNQLVTLVDATYPHSDIAGKYGKLSPLNSFFLTKGKGNAFMAKEKVVFEKLYLRDGIKRLLYKIKIRADLTLYFAHFSLNRKVRTRQFSEIADRMAAEKGEVIIIGDFNILDGLQELAPILNNERFRLLNDKDRPTFKFHRFNRLLDLCIVSKALAEKASLDVLAQSFSDHEALFLRIAP